MTDFPIHPSVFYVYDSYLVAHRRLLLLLLLLLRNAPFSFGFLSSLLPKERCIHTGYATQVITAVCGVLR